MDLGNIFMIVLLVFGFGFIVFFHELGHFLAAKWADVKVEQFAVGFGQALISWRSGVGLTWGNTERRMEKLKDAAAATGQPPPVFGDTEYRLNWMPLGGYVKMLGQDDLAPNAGVDDPRAYNKRPVGKRMVIVSAGVVMNLLLALIGFFALFLHGFKELAPVVGTVQCGSPAQQAGLQAGDRIISLDGSPILGFNKLMMRVATSRRGVLPIVIRRPGVDHDIELSITPAYGASDNGMPMIGVTPAPEMESSLIAGKPLTAKEQEDLKDLPPIVSEFKAGDAVTAIDGEPVNPATDYFKLDRALQASGGKAVPVTVTSTDGSKRQVLIPVRFGEPFNGQDTNFFAGLEPRAAVFGPMEDSPLRGFVKPGDVIVGISVVGDPAIVPIDSPGLKAIQAATDAAGKVGEKVVFALLRGTQRVLTSPTVPSLSFANNKKGLGVGLVMDTANPVIGETDAGTAAEEAKVAPGATILKLDGKPVANWFDVHAILATAKAGQDVGLVTDKGAYTLHLSEDDVQGIHDRLYATDATSAWKELEETRRTANIITAARWGADETGEVLTEAYLTLHRIMSGRVSARNLSGPIGIFHLGTEAADRGVDWLLWFLSMISVNLAVVNFLPIPIVDGGLFVFLIIEKLQRRPISPKVQTVAQVVGLALIVSVFLFVSYSDVMRWTQH
jgi:regulator of sigma E protease